MHGQQNIECETSAVANLTSRQHHLHCAQLQRALCLRSYELELQADQYLTVVFIRLIVWVHMLDFTDNEQLPFGRNQSSATKQDRLLTRESHYWNNLLWHHRMVRQMAYTRRCMVKGTLLLNDTVRN